MFDLPYWTLEQPSIAIILPFCIIFVAVGLSPPGLEGVRHVCSIGPVSVPSSAIDEARKHVWLQERPHLYLARG